MSREPIAQLIKDGKRYELVYPEYGLTIRGPYVEWVLEAGAEMIAKIEKTKLEGTLEEIEMMAEFVDGADAPMKIEALRFESNNRFEVVPQCVVSMGDTDYRWISKSGDTEQSVSNMERLYDTSNTRKKNWLEHQH